MSMMTLGVKWSNFFYLTRSHSSDESTIQLGIPNYKCVFNLEFQPEFVIQLGIQFEWE